MKDQWQELSVIVLFCFVFPQTSSKQNVKHMNCSGASSYWSPTAVSLLLLWCFIIVILVNVSLSGVDLHFFTSHSPFSWLLMFCFCSLPTIPRTCCTELGRKWSETLQKHKNKKIFLHISCGYISCWSTEATVLDALRGWYQSLLRVCCLRISWWFCQTTGVIRVSCWPCSNLLFPLEGRQWQGLWKPCKRWTLVRTVAI